MNDPNPVKLELNQEELSLLEDHLRRHLDQVDKEFIRTENRTLRHHIVHEVEVLEAVVNRLHGLRG